MSVTEIAIAAVEARHACAGEPDIIERVKKAMMAARRHWVVTDPDKQFRAAVSAAILESEGDEKDRLERSVKSLNRVNAMLQALTAGVPVDVEAMAAEQQDDDLIPLVDLWHGTDER